MTRIFLRFSVTVMALSIVQSENYQEQPRKYIRMDTQQDFSLIIDFTCVTAKKELEKHPEMQTIAMVELENNFPFDFSRKVLKCLPEDVSKMILNPHTRTKDDKFILPKQTMVIYVADVVLWYEDDFYQDLFYFHINFPVVNHLSKFLILTSDENEIETTKEIFNELLNVVQIYEKNRKVIAKSFDTTQNLAAFETFEDLRLENRSQILFPDKANNLNGQELYAAYTDGADAYRYRFNPRPNCKWTSFLDIIEEKLNATVKYAEIEENKTSTRAFYEDLDESIIERIEVKHLDFFLNYPAAKFGLESFNHLEWCLIAPLPKNYSITELILFMPLDKSCWMWLGITIAISTFVWRISEGHWNFVFGAFSYFMGQAQLVVRIRTNRLPMKILLQLWILVLFIFSNGYQSIVTSFMLNPMQQRFLMSLDDVYGSDLNLENFSGIEKLQGNNPKYQKALQDGRIIDFDIPSSGAWSNFIAEKHLAVAQPCKLMKNRIELQSDGKSYKGLYLLPEVVDTELRDLYIRPFHPYLDKFQELMDRSFESGLHQAWERFYWEIWSEGIKRQRKEEEDNLLDFKEIIPFFLILAIGFVSALLALFCEFFHRDFVSQLSRDYFKRKFDEIFRRERKKKTKKAKVRRIQVKPAMRRKSV